MGIPIDMSHASDKLAFDILERVARRHTSAQLVASHCNFRAVKKHERNLSDEVALEVVSRGGVIGLNLIRGFVGDTIQDFARHYLHGLELGLEDALCLGADFFCPEDLPSKPSSSDDYFLPGFGTAACHPALQKTLLEAGVSTHQLGKLTNSNLDQWLGRLLAAHSSVAGH
jgi:microsomal dipeptidase-like Zn-dependent dipeptidase